MIGAEFDPDHVVNRLKKAMEDDGLEGTHSTSGASGWWNDDTLSDFYDLRKGMKEAHERSKKRYSYHYKEAPENYKWSEWSRPEPYHGGEQMEFVDVIWNSSWIGGTSEKYILKAFDLTAKAAKSKGLKFYEIWKDMKTGKTKMRFHWKRPDRSQIFSGQLLPL